MAKFGAPGTCIKEYDRWTVLLRPQQVTLGALVLICNEPVTAFSDVSEKAFADLAQVTGDIERTLAAQFAFDKMNYLMLMMVDPDVHFHVLPRYAGPKAFAGHDFRDSGWPGPPDLASVNTTDAACQQSILAQLKDSWA